MRTVVLLPGKLLQADNTFPLLFEMDAAGLISNPLIVCQTKVTYWSLREHPTLSMALERLGGRLSHLVPVPRNLTGIPRRLAKYVVRARNVWTLRDLLLRPTIFFTATDFPLISALARWNKRVFGGRRLHYLLENRPTDVMKTFNMSAAFRLGHPVRRLIPDCDAFLSSYSFDDYSAVDTDIQVLGDFPLIQVGYTRGMHAWRRFLRQATEQILELEINRSCFVFFPLSVLQREDNIVLDFRDVFRDILGILKEFENTLQIVFRYHPTSDRQLVEDIVEKAGITNFVFSDAHPLMLVKIAAFTICFTSSSLAADAMAAGCPVVEYTRHHPDVFKLTGGRSEQPAAVDHFVHDDPDELREVVANLVNAKREVRTPPTMQGENGYWNVEAAELAALLGSIVNSDTKSDGRIKIVREERLKERQ